MNILILSCGTRNMLVEFFRRRFDRVIGTDCSALAPALYACSGHYMVPRMKEPEYLPCILDICEQEEIDAILPLQEDELHLMAENRDLFEDRGIDVLVSDVEVIDLCRDKYNFYEFLKQNGIPTLKTWKDLASFRRDYEAGEAAFPVFVKPRDGMGSEDAGIVGSMELLESRCGQSPELLIQEYCDGEEYGADVFCDFLTDDVVDIGVKKKIRMRAGETEKAVTVTDPQIRELVKKTAEALKARGEIDMDLFGRNGQYYVSEVNPRFGGGFPHSYLNGMDTPAYIRANLESRVNPSHLEEVRKPIYTMKYSAIMALNPEQ